MISNPFIFKDIKASSLLFDHILIKYYINVEKKKNSFQCKLTDVVLFKLGIGFFHKILY